MAHITVNVSFLQRVRNLSEVKFASKSSAYPHCSHALSITTSKITSHTSCKHIQREKQPLRPNKASSIFHRCLGHFSTISFTKFLHPRPFLPNVFLDHFFQTGENKIGKYTYLFLSASQNSIFLYIIHLLNSVIHQAIFPSQNPPTQQYWLGNCNFLLPNG